MDLFTKVPMKRPPSNTFPLSHDRKMSIELKRLYNALVMECVPGDHFTLSTAVMTRFAPLVAPVMHRCSVYMHFFFCPNRLVWPNWEDFITGGEDGTASPAFPTIPLTITQYNSSEKFDYMGLPAPIGAVFTEPINALPFGADTLIYNEYYRDQNLQGKLEYELLDGDNAGNPDLLLNHTRSWMHDYFTSALPWTQRGPEATIPLGSTADINVTGSGLVLDPTIASTIQRVDGSAFGADDITFNASATGIASGTRITGTLAAIDTTTNTSVDPANVSVDLSTASAASINDLRNAFRLQEFLENNARGGSRYTEVIYAHFGVRNPDARLQRPEFIGGFGNPISFSEVLQTSETDTTPQANLAGHGISVGQNNGFKYHVKEHGFIMGYISVMPKTAYYQGLPKLWSKFDKFDYYWKEFAHLGEQPILNKELYLADDGENDTVFGYTPRYAEYKYIPSTVHGSFRTTEQYWTMVRDFASRPLLNSTFLTGTDGIERIFAVTADAPQLWVHIHHSIKARRLMPYFGVPTF